ncbi:MAG: hypothetical protein QXP31_09280 [Pyrobaculum sp.]
MAAEAEPTAAGALLILLALSALALAGVLYLDAARDVVEVETQCGNVYIMPAKYHPYGLHGIYVVDPNVTAARNAALKAAEEMKKRYGENWDKVEDPLERWWRWYQHQNLTGRLADEYLEQLAAELKAQLEKSRALVYRVYPPRADARLPEDRVSTGLLIAMVHIPDEEVKAAVMRTAADFSKTYNMSVVVVNYPVMKFWSRCNDTMEYIIENVTSIDVPHWGRAFFGFGGDVWTPPLNDSDFHLFFHAGRAPTPRQLEEVKKYLAQTKLARVFIFYTEGPAPPQFVVPLISDTRQELRKIGAWTVALISLSALGVAVAVRKKKT